MAEQELNRTQVGARLEEMDRERVAERVGRNRLGELRASDGALAGSWTALRVMGFSGCSPGKSQCRGRSTCHQARSTSSSLGERSFLPLPCAMRSTIRRLSMAGTVRWMASEMRRPAA